VLRERMMPLVLKAWAGRRREILADALQLLLAFDEDLNNRLVTVGAVAGLRCWAPAAHPPRRAWCRTARGRRPRICWRSTNAPS